MFRVPVALVLVLLLSSSRAISAHFLSSLTGSLSTFGSALSTASTAVSSLRTIGERVTNERERKGDAEGAARMRKLTNRPFGKVPAWMGGGVVMLTMLKDVPIATLLQLLRPMDQIQRWLDEIERLPDTAARLAWLRRHAPYVRAEAGKVLRTVQAAVGSGGPFHGVASSIQYEVEQGGLLEDIVSIAWRDAKTLASAVRSIVGAKVGEMSRVEGGGMREDKTEGESEL